MMKRLLRCGYILVAIAAMAFLGSCFGEEEPQEEEWERLLVLHLDQDVVVPTSVVQVVLSGTSRMEADRAEITLEGEIGGREVSESFELDAVRDGEVGDLHVDLDASQLLWPLLTPGDGERFRGTMNIELQNALGISTRGRLENISLLFVDELRPELVFDAPEQLFTNATIEVEGDGVLRPGEGETVAVIESGQLVADAGHTIDLDGARLPVEWSGERGNGELRIDPSVVGVHPGELVATIRFENTFSDGTTLSGTTESASLESRIDTTFIASLSRNSGSRGQLVEISGRGFVPSGGSGASAYGMLLRFEGTLTPADASQDVINLQGGAAPEIVPFKVVNDELIAQDVWYRVVERELEGLGAVPGVFDGQITPIVYDQYGEVQGIEWDGQFEILPTKQVVFLRYLPSFSVALDRYGLANVEFEIREQILEVTNRDFDGFNVEFVDQPPQDFVAYSTVELGGPDPTGGNAFGIDNTFHDQAKDTGNLYIDDYLGGINWDTGEEYDNPYGGVFVESFANFSPTIHPEMSHGSENFDRVFGPFMPELGGDRVRATEWPDGDRSDDIAEAIRVFGNVVGNTASHEMGHALGMAHFETDWETPGHRFHNLEAEGCIMDAGVDRSFEQRAEIDGEGPGVFSDQNRDYLEEILPE